MRRWFVLPLLLVLTSPALGWDTRTVATEDGAESWTSAYLSGPPANLLPETEGFARDEHSELAHIALYELGVAAEFGILTETTGLATLDLVDLNAALTRRSLMSEMRVGDDAAPESVLEERLLPPPAHFAGLPDYTFTVYDWINKSTLCPTLAPGTLFFDRCHVYFGGYLTVFNSSHFGSQPVGMYERYHTIALNLAARAQMLRTMLEAASPATAAAHEIYVKERESEALAYEGFAQHFLQDRWSLGHMWERWSGPDQRRAANIFLSSFVGAVAGLIHGSEALTGLPDPMSSPLVNVGPPLTVTPLVWRSSVDGVNHPGFGDERLRDLYDGGFGREYGLPDTPVATPLQRSMMLECSKAGWAEVIRGFGRNAQGRYGAWNVMLPEISFPPVLTTEQCWENWALNGTIRAAWVDDVIVTSAEDLSRSVVELAGGVNVFAGLVTATTLDVLRAELTALTARIRARAKALPASTNLARGQIGAVAGIEPGNAYAYDDDGQPDPPDYAEPEDLDDLPEADVQHGGDKRAVFGLFNRAHADFWCTNLAARLAPLRGSTDPIDLAACAYLADRAYKGTAPEYRGLRRERLRHGNDDIEPICANFGVTATGGDELPYELHPGYVEMANARGPYAHRSIGAWCRKVPVVDAGPCNGETPPDDDIAWDVVGRVAVSGGTVRLTGRHFGAAQGDVGIALSDSGPFVAGVPVSSWSDTEIVLAIPPNFRPAGDWFLQIRPSPTADESRWSVGRFVLQVGGELCAGAEPGLVGLWRIGRPSMSISPLEVFLFADGTVVQYDNQFFTTWHTTATWSTVGDTISIEPCPGIPPGKASFRFHGTWSLHPESDRFGVISCPGPQADECPAMRGEFTRVFDDGSEIPIEVELNSEAGYLTLDTVFPVRPIQDCHGGCWQRWSIDWPHVCAEVGLACGTSSAPICAGECPDAFLCAEIDGGCYCVTETPIFCEPPNGPCPVNMVCRSNGVCVN